MHDVITDVTAYTQKGRRGKLRRGGRERGEEESKVVHS
jgi:hypothetical protein